MTKLTGYDTKYLETIEEYDIGNENIKLHYLFKFDNNYGASVIKSKYSYGGEEDLFELAVIRWNSNGKYDLVYYTEITDDVIGWLSNEEILKLLERIKNLK